MRQLIFIVSLLFAAVAGATGNVKARLISEMSTIAPGRPITVALEFDIREGWHTYWRNPGDSGQATKIAWTLPPGFTAGPIQWTTPHRFEIPPLVNYGYAKHAVHMVTITTPSDLQAGARATLSATGDWLVCSDICVPESGDFTLTLPVGPGARDPASAQLFAAARAELPQTPLAPASAALNGSNLVLTLGQSWGTALTQIQSLAFFPYAQGSIEYAAPQAMTRTADSIQLSMKVGYERPQSGPIDGVLVAVEGTGVTAASVPFVIAATFAGAGAAGTPGPAVQPAAAAAPNSVAQSTSSLLLLAVAGGLILNLMPCVFPVLSIKAIGLVEQAKRNAAAVRMKGLVFAGGVITSMLILAGVLLALRAGGQQIGWGFQLQSPLFVTLMAYLLLAVGLNLSGVFEVGGSLAGVGDNLTRGDGYRASFFTGVLTTLVATPCTAPFMAAAVGAALTQSPMFAMAIFAALGFGLALPYLLLSFVPVLRQALPKPGAWMDVLKQLFAFPMYASAAWLLWVLAQQTTPGGLAAALAGLVCVALAAWAFQKSRGSLGGGRVVALATAALAIVAALILPTRFETTAAAVRHEASAEGWVPYDQGKLESLIAAGKPVLVNFTASWCLTCLVNERNAFADSAVQDIFHHKGVVLMKGDWTNQDPVITRALSSFGRAGVPLYVVYNNGSGSKDPLVLPQLLTAGLVGDTFSKLN